LIMGLQHAFAMVGGLITPPFVVFKFTVNFGAVALQQAAISGALITSGICTIINILQLPVPFSEKIFGRKMFLGSGVLSVMGTSFTFLPVFEIAIQQMKNDGIDGTVAFGKMLGTVIVCSLVEVFFSMFPPKVVKKIFPPLVTSVTIMLIGIALTGTGMKYWGGGVVCAEMGWKEHAQLKDLGVSPIPGPTCFNGDVALGYGSPQFIGLGFSVMSFLVFIELFGSTFMKNCNVVLALLFGYLIAGVSNHEGADYVTGANIQNAPAITFLWVESFPIGFYAPAVLPLLVAFIVTTVESIGDIGATYEASQLALGTEEYDRSIQGGLLADAFNSILASLFLSMPNTTFSQNNGVIALVRSPYLISGQKTVMSSY
jgi:uracil-xanthine permease